MACRASLSGAARSTHVGKRFGHGSRENSLTRSLSPSTHSLDISRVNDVSVSFLFKSSIKSFTETSCKLSKIFRLDSIQIQREGQDF